MIPIAESVVDWGGLLEVVLASLLAGIGVPAAFGIAILGSVRAAELSREDKGLAAGVYGVVGVLAFGIVVASVVFGVAIMTTK